MKFVLILPLLLCISCVGQTERAIKPSPSPTPPPVYASGPPPQPSCPEVRGEFMVTQNELYSEKVRHMEVYLSPSSFDEKNLRALFACLSQGNPKPEHLTVTVETDRSRVHIPDGKPGTGISGGPVDPHEYDFLKAIYYRRPAVSNRMPVEYFRYSPRTHLDQFYWTKVVIKK